MAKPLSRLTRISAVVWLTCFVGVLGIFGYVIGIRQEMFDKASDEMVIALLGLILIGIVAFLVGIISLTAQLVERGSAPKQNFLIRMFKLFFILAILPLYLVFTILSPFMCIRKLKQDGIRGLVNSIRLRSVFIRFGGLAVTLVIIFPIWVVGYATVGVMTKEALGYTPEAISISGTGSMYPTFPKGEGKDPKELAKQIVGTPGMTRYPNGLAIGGKRYFNYELGRGDIVLVESDKIREMTSSVLGNPSGWVKRVIGMPGDTIELREGIVYLNSEPLKEPYIAKPRSTFGEAYLSECKKATVPDNSIFVMGDNRKGSGDSREIGFIEISAINHVLPMKNQIGILDKTWRDVSMDFDEGSKIRLDKDKYIQLLNEKRKEAGVKELKYQPKLETSASKRGEVILKFNDFSFEATQSGYTQAKAMRDANYSNIVWGEAPTIGYYEAEELIDNQFQFPETIKFLIEKKYQEVGISEVEGSLNGCPTQIIVQHFAGYVPPNYNPADIDGWKTNLTRLREIQPSWNRLKESGNFYQNNKSDVDRVNDILSIRISNLTAIVARMEANQWFTAAEQKMIDQDKVLFDEQDALGKRLNSITH
jgi:signal peptidase I